MSQPNGRVLIVDDSAFMRIALRRIIESEDRLTVVGEARNGSEAVALAATLKPDVITMDVEMAGMDGLTATREILTAPGPHPSIIMVSSHTQQGAAATVEALLLGAVDFVSKSSELAQQDLGHVDTQLRVKLRFWADRPRPATSAPVAPPPVQVHTALPARADLVVVGASTGGPAILGRFLAATGRLSVPMVIAQHMPARYTASLAEILRDETKLDVVEGTNRMALLPGRVVFIPGGTDAVIAPGPSGYELRLTTCDASVHPNVDLLFSSAAVAARKPVAVILTGMGEDGTAGARKLHSRGLRVLVQSPETCVVDGMPGAAIAAGVATEILPVESIGQRLAGLARWTAG
jgi:two-component system chemotaxis response regulator CheB